MRRYPIWACVLALAACTDNANLEEKTKSSSDRLTLAAPMSEARAGFDALVVETGPLAGQVVVSGDLNVGYGGGGNISVGQEVFDPAADMWTSIDEAQTRAIDTSMVGLADGDVVVLGGRNPTDLTPRDAVHRYDAATGWSSPGTLSAPRAQFAAARVTTGSDSGWILVVGGLGTGDVALSTAELFDPSTGNRQALPNMSEARVNPLATTIGGAGPSAGRVLISGGCTAQPAPGNGSCAGILTAEVYNPATRTFSAPVSMSVARAGHSATPLPDGRVLVFGGYHNVSVTGSAVLFDPAAGQFTPAATGPARAVHSATAIGSRVLIGGGAQGLTATNDMTLYDVAADTWTPSGRLLNARLGHAAVRLPDGTLLFMAGSSNLFATRLTSVERSSASLADGDACDNGVDCASFFCVDGVCCDTPCDGQCVACSAADKGQGADGVCGPIIPSSTPVSECAATPAATCGADGSCDGAGACRLHVQGTVCGTAPMCSGNTSQGGEVCNGAGVCQTQGTTNCAPYVCDALSGSCPQSCASDAQCAQGSFCDSATSTCEAQGADGDACTRAPECTSGNCVDGVCCASACDGICEACSAAAKGGGNDGTCGPIVAGQDPDSECNPANPPCGQTGECNGAGACEVAAFGTECGTTSCSENTANPSACDGQGSCVEQAPQNCAPFACDEGCKTSCATDDDCSQGNVCDTSGGQCVPPGSSCVDEDTSQTTGGEERECSPYLCSENRCLEECVSSNQCVSGFVCDTATKACVRGGGGADSKDEGGCGCVVPSSGSSGTGLTAFVLALAAALRRRARRRVERGLPAAGQ